MNLTYHCTTCKEDKPSTEEHWTPSSLKIAKEKPNRSNIGYCKSCVKIVSASYIKKLKDARLTRSRNPIDRNIIGKLYIIGPKENKNNRYPYKIGISSGTTVDKRLTSLQTSHWIDLTILYESNILDHVSKIEALIHSQYSDKKIRGEWYKITKKDIQSIITQIERACSEYYTNPQND